MGGQVCPEVRRIEVGFLAGGQGVDEAKARDSYQLRGPQLRVNRRPALALVESHLAGHLVGWPGAGAREAVNRGRGLDQLLELGLRGAELSGIAPARPAPDPAGAIAGEDAALQSPRQ